MEVIFGDAGRQLYHDAVFASSFLFLDPTGQVAEFPMQRPAATASTGQIERAIGFVLWIVGKTARALMERLLTAIPGTALFDDVALYGDHVILVLQAGHFLSFDA